jgi:hypothetical protein
LRKKSHALSPLEFSWSITATKKMEKYLNFLSRRMQLNLRAKNGVFSSLEERNVYQNPFYCKARAASSWDQTRTLAISSLQELRNSNASSSSEKNLFKGNFLKVNKSKEKTLLQLLPRG